MKNILLSLLVLSSTVVQAQTTQQQDMEFTYRDQLVTKVEQFLDRTANIFTVPFLSERDIDCLARNIFYESANESLEGKVAVGVVTINRVQDPRYPKTVCDVVYQRNTITTTKIIKPQEQDRKLFTRQEPPKTVTTHRVVYQFSWVGQRTAKIQQDDPRWIESRRIAQELSRGGYIEYRDKYRKAKNFHAVYVNPQWNLPRIARVGNHIFYENPPKRSVDN